jgi:hypothetical protein
MIARGILRVCDDCDYETLERTEMRFHERTTGHDQDRSKQDEVKQLTPEQKMIRQKYGRKATKMVG